MNNEPMIELAKKSDLSAIVMLLQKTGLPPDGIEPHLENFLIIRNQEIADGPGFLMGSVGLEIYGESALLRSFAVHPDFQSQGLGSQLLTRAIGIAKDLGIRRLFLLTDTAEEYFKKKGFTIVSRDQVPAKMKQSVEFTKLCTSSPSMMLEI